jgi:actin-related protein
MRRCHYNNDDTSTSNHIKQITQNQATVDRSPGAHPNMPDKQARRRKGSPSKAAAAAGAADSPQPSKKRSRLTGTTDSSNSSPNKTLAPDNNNKPLETKTSIVNITPSPSHVLIVDNGGDTIKYGWMKNNDDDDSDGVTAVLPHRISNMTARLKHQWTVLVGDEYQQTVQRNPQQIYGVTRSTERGIVTNVGNQIQVWKRIMDHLNVIIPNLDKSEASKAFGWNVVDRRRRKNKNVTATTTNNNNNKQPQVDDTTSEKNPAVKKIPAALVAVLLLVPPYCPRVVLDQIMYVWMEDFGVSHVGFATSQVCAASYQPHVDFQTCCLVDMGWSATHVVPTFRGTAIAITPNTNKQQHTKKKTDEESNKETTTTRSSSSCPIRRMPIGGRHLVNLWKYYASYRQWNLMDQEPILRHVFHDLAYVSHDFNGEMTLARYTRNGQRPFDRNFILPDYQTTFRGQVDFTDFQKHQQQQQLQQEQQQKRKEEEVGKTQQQHQQQDDEAEESDDEDFIIDDDDDKTAEDDDNIGDDDKSGSEPEEKKAKKSKGHKKKRKRKDTEDDDDDDDDEVEDTALLRQQLLRQKQAEETRRREQEAEQQVLAVSVERFTIPEVLFRPSDAGLSSEMAGLPQMIVQSIKACPKYLQAALYRSIQISGGLAQLPNLRERLQQELRALVPNQFELEVTISSCPMDQAWLGARERIQALPHTQWSVSRDEWELSQRRKAWMKLLTTNAGMLV